MDARIQDLDQGTDQDRDHVDEGPDLDRDRAVAHRDIEMADDKCE
jgi:hypothetical protein